MPYTPPTRDKDKEKAVRSLLSSSTASLLAKHSNSSSSSVSSVTSNSSKMNRFYLNDDDNINPPKESTPKKRYPFINNSTPTSTLSSLRSGAGNLQPTTPITPMPPSDDDVLKFSTESPQSYSYTLVSPNSLALRLNVLKRSLQILLDRPEWIKQSVKSTPSTPTAERPPLSRPQLGRSASTTANVMQNFIRFERKSSMSNILQSFNDKINLQDNNNNNNSEKSNNNTDEEDPFDDLKEIVTFLENGIDDLSIDNNEKFIDLHNLSLSNAKQLSKRTNLRINLLEALATPFLDKASPTKLAGLPLTRSSPSTIGLNQLNTSNSAASLTSNSNTLLNNTTGRQFHMGSAGKNVAPKAIFTCELDSPWDLKNANDVALLIFGFSRNTIRSMRLMDLIAPRSRDLVSNRLFNGEELIFSGEIIAIKRNDNMAWTSLWAKRKDDFMILIFELVPCDAIDLVINKQVEEYVVDKFVENNSVLFKNKNLKGLAINDFLPTMNKVLNSGRASAQDDCSTINKTRYFTIKVNDNNSLAPCAITSEELDKDCMRLHLHSLPYMAGTFIISSVDFRILSFNSAIAKNLFGTSKLKNQSIDSIIPSFTKLIQLAMAENPHLKNESGLVLPEHYFRKLNAELTTTSPQERQLQFLNSIGLNGLHSDGSLFKVDVQLRVLSDDLMMLWITYSRNSISTTPIKFDDITESLHSLKPHALESNQVVNVPNQLQLLNESDLHSTDNDDSLGRSDSYRAKLQEQRLKERHLLLPPSPEKFVVTRSRSDSAASSTVSSIDSVKVVTGSSGTSSGSSSESTIDVKKFDSFKLIKITPGKKLLKIENDQLAKLTKHSKYWPVKVGDERRSKKFSDFKVLKNLGHGAYGNVVVGQRMNDPEYTVCIKAIFKERILVDTWVRDRQLGTIPSEIQILNTINIDPHPNIQRLVDFFEDDNCYYLESLQHGDNPAPAIDLFDLIEVKADSMTELECKYIYYQIASAMSHLHTHGIVHRDIKDENIIIDSNFVVKLIDFGSAAYAKNGPFGVFVGTIDYAAPEVLNGKPYEGKSQDVWAMGVLLYTLVFKENPFVSVDEILDGGFQIPDGGDEDVVDLIRLILIKDVNERPSMKEILEHKWLAGMK